MANYPDSIVEFREVENLPGLVFDASDKKTLFAEDVKKLDDEVVAIEQALGVEISGTFDTLAERLDAITTAVESVPNIHVGTTPPVLPSAGDLWVDTN